MEALAADGSAANTTSFTIENADGDLSVADPTIDNVNGQIILGDYDTGL